MTQEAFGRAARTYGDTIYRVARTYGDTIYRVALPLISSGAYDYPRDQALKVSVDTIGAFCSGTI